MTDKAMVTNAMVEAGVEEIRKARHQGFDRWTDREAIGAVLSAALAQAEQPVAVKPLEWTKCTSPKGAWAAVSVAGDYIIRTRADTSIARLSIPEVSGWAPYDSLDDAKAAAEDSYQRRILSALSPSKIEAGENTAETGAPVTDLRGTLTPKMIRDTAGWSQSEDDLRDTLRWAADELERALAGSPPPQPNVVVDEAILEALSFAMGWQPSEDGPSYREAKEFAIDKIKAALSPPPVSSLPLREQDRLNGEVGVQKINELLDGPAPVPHLAGLDEATKQKLREALRFSASRSVMSAEDERRILAALATTEGSDNG